MTEIIKNVLFYLALISGSIMIICLLIAGIIKCCCILLDQLKVAKVIKEAIILYAKTKNQDLKIREVDLKKQRISKDRGEGSQ